MAVLQRFVPEFPKLGIRELNWAKQGIHGAKQTKLTLPSGATY